MEISSNFTRENTLSNNLTEVSIEQLICMEFLFNSTQERKEEEEVELVAIRYWADNLITLLDRESEGKG